MNRRFVSARKAIVAAMVVIATSLCGTKSYAQEIVVDSVVSGITNMIAVGNADSLATFFNQRVELSLPDYSLVSSRNQARMILRQFFAQNTPTEFNVLAQNEGQNGYFVSGMLNSGDTRYRVSFLTKEQSNQQVVYQFTIE
ncbi:MAG: DUF4783 domain-containing protein [Salinivirgaceae bacterium]|nr:DUF4783 domain-containing protein [Salinivirgaceae bacterium]